MVSAGEPGDQVLFPPLKEAKTLDPIRGPPRLPSDPGYKEYSTAFQNASNLKQLQTIAQPE